MKDFRRCKSFEVEGAAKCCGRVGEENVSKLKQEILEGSPARRGFVHGRAGGKEIYAISLKRPSVRFNIFEFLPRRWGVVMLYVRIEQSEDWSWPLVNDLFWWREMFRLRPTPEDSTASQKCDGEYAEVDCISFPTNERMREPCNVLLLPMMMFVVLSCRREGSKERRENGAVM